MCLNLRKFEFSIVWIHFSNLLPCRRSQNLYKKKKKANCLDMLHMELGLKYNLSDTETTEVNLVS